MKGFILTIVSAALGSVASTTGAKGSDCIKVEPDLDRLACYDQFHGRTPKQERVSTTPAATKWNVRKETSAMTDQTNVFMYRDSEETINCGWNRGEKIRLVARCMDNTTSLIFQTGCHMTSSQYNDYGHIQYRIDSEPARTLKAQESTNNRSLGLWSGGTSIPVIKQMFGKTQLITKMTPYSENPFTATFDISGMEEAIAPLRQSCGW